MKHQEEARQDLTTLLVPLLMILQDLQAAQEEAVSVAEVEPEVEEDNNPSI
jgi:hypothetical protein